MPANFILLLAAAIWGFGFVAQVFGMDHLSPFAFNGVRFLIGALSLLPLVWYFKRKGKLYVSQGRDLLWGSLMVGSLLFAGASLQQVGLLYTTAANAGFITGLYIVLVPVLGLALKHSTGLNTWLGCGIAVLGLFFLSVKDDFSIGYGDLLQLLGACFWAMHILAVDHFAKRVSPVILAQMQFLVCGVLSLLISAGFETTEFGNVTAAWASLAYSGLISVGIGYTLQVMAQKHAHPAHAAIILSLETVFAAIGGILLLDESLSVRELTGCGLMLFGMLVSQVPLRYLVKSQQESLN
ncbi:MULTISPECIES: DMT family transporter [Shewanella]|uniref:DMT family transporter n=1 Tax=Shewanella salipaludis TaxID=2723052 RepID=A0A972JJW7_9GAMM|nr:MULTISPECIES: DMT family transporter [Shewanella]MCE9685050.1 DMT family transporter [Shewanella sp. AS16]NMH64509.1 DMT family transporter [Shewanella salipaludis]